MFRTTLSAGIGGFAGTCARFCLSENLGADVCGLSLPIGTFVANMLGCLAIGCLYGYIARSGRMSRELSAMLITGFCGGLTTFSAFSGEMMALIEGGHPVAFAAYMVVSIALGISMVAVGSKLTGKKQIEA